MWTPSLSSAFGSPQLRQRIIKIYDTHSNSGSHSVVWNSLASLSALDRLRSPLLERLKVRPATCQRHLSSANGTTRLSPPALPAQAGTCAYQWLVSAVLARQKCCAREAEGMTPSRRQAESLGDRSCQPASWIFFRAGKRD